MLETLVRHLHLVRLSAVATAVFAFGCTGLIDDGGTGGLTPEQAEARRAWVQEAKPVLAQNCAACHTGSRMNIAFMEGADVIAQRDDLLAFEPVVVNLEAPQSSRLLTKGLHSGPALTAAQASIVLQWIQTQNGRAGQHGPDEQPEPRRPRRSPRSSARWARPAPPTCPINDVDTRRGRRGRREDSVRRSSRSARSSTSPTSKLIPGPDGVYIEHPLFVS